MHILILSQRNASAQNRLLQAAQALAEHFDVAPELVEALQPKVKEADVRALKEREAVAELLETLAIQVGALPPAAEPSVTPQGDVTAVTDEAPLLPEAGSPTPASEETTAEAESISEKESATSAKARTRKSKAGKKK